MCVYTYICIGVSPGDMLTRVAHVNVTPPHYDTREIRRLLKGLCERDFFMLCMRIYACMCTNMRARYI